MLIFSFTEVPWSLISFYIFDESRQNPSLLMLDAVLLSNWYNRKRSRKYTGFKCYSELPFSLFTVSNEVAKVMFLHLSVSHSVHREGSVSVHAGTPHPPPRTRHPPGTRHLHPPGPGTVKYIHYKICLSILKVKLFFRLLMIILNACAIQTKCPNSITVWLRVTLVVALGFLLQNLEKWWGPMNGTFSFYECWFSGGDTMR